MNQVPTTREMERSGQFGVRLRHAREAAHLTQEELAERAGLTANAISALERGEHRHPYPATVRALAAALGMTEAERAELAAAIPKRRQAMVAEPGFRFELPAALSPLLGREHEVAAIVALLRREGGRLVTLTGAGGVGKTSLALRVAAEVVGDFAAGAAFVPLAAVQDPDLVATAVGQALGVGETGARSIAERLGDALRDRHLLLVLDNFEHLLAAAPLVTTLLSRCPRLVILATSRAALRLAGERTVLVPPLALPKRHDLSDPDHLAGFAAIRLFADRARAADGAFALSADNVASVAAICDRLDGLPLAIELAAAHSHLFSPAALLSRLGRRLPLLTKGRRDGPARHQTMRDTIAWSYDLLAPDEQSVFRRLAVFTGGFSLEAAERVTGDGLPSSVLACLSTLIDHRLVQRIDHPVGEPRFAMLETIREFAAEQLAASGAEQASRDAHSAWCLELAEKAAPFWFTPAQAVWADKLDAEHDNLRSALAWATDDGGSTIGLRLSGRLWPYWFIRGHFTEGRAWLEHALAWEGDTRGIERVRALTGYSCFVRSHGDEPLATALGEAALRIAEEIGAGAGIDAVHILIGLSLTAALRGDQRQSVGLSEKVLALLRAIGDAHPSAAPLETTVLVNLAAIAFGEGDDARATALVETALADQRRSDFAWSKADALYVLALIHARQGDLSTTTALCRESLALAWDHYDPSQVLLAIERIALIAATIGYHTAAVRLVGVAERLYEQLGVLPEQFGSADRDEELAALCSQLGEVQYAAGLAAGRTLPLDQAVAEALTLADTCSADIARKETHHLGQAL